MPKQATGKFHRIPKFIRFPFGYTVKVVSKTSKQLEEMAGSAVYALWVDDENTIYLAKDLPAARRRAILLHELVHAWADFQLYCTEIGLTKP